MILQFITTGFLISSLHPWGSFAHASFVSGSIQRAHDNVLQHTRALTRDMRTSFDVIRKLISFPKGVAPKTFVIRRENSKGAFCTLGNQAVLRGSGSGPGVPRNGTSATPTGTTTAPHSTPTTIPPASPWKLFQSYEGDNFFDGWNFFVGDDQLNSITDYLDQSTAQSTGLSEINARGNAVIRVETTATVLVDRQSVRLQTNIQFNGGLVIMDSIHMPTGCGTWPAFWSNGPNWPAGGEIDIIEGVHDYTNNQATIHTDPGCTLATTSSSVLGMSGSIVGGTDCATATTGNQGCGIRAASNNTFGAGFNDNGGGTYAMKWDMDGVSVYFFPRGSEPADITSKVPQPDTWGVPQAVWSAATCDPFKYFSNQQLIIDTVLCGNWASSVWSVSGIPGQDQSCAQRTGFSTCEEFVRTNGASFNEAYWEVQSVLIYQQQNSTPPNVT